MAGLSRRCQERLRSVEERISFAAIGALSDVRPRLADARRAAGSAKFRATFTLDRECRDLLRRIEQDLNAVLGTPDFSDNQKLYASIDKILLTARRRESSVDERLRIEAGRNVNLATADHDEKDDVNNNHRSH